MYYLPFPSPEYFNGPKDHVSIIQFSETGKQEPGTGYITQLDNKSGMRAKIQAEAYTEPENSKILPAGYIKILDAFRALIRERDFSTITWAEIAKTAGVNEALIYKYFRDKRGLLHQAMAEGLKHFISQLEQSLKGVDGALNKIQKLIWYHINSYNNNRIFARIQMIEVNSYQEYFQSDAYKLAKQYGRIILKILKEGVKNGEIRNDIKLKSLRQHILGAIELHCLPNVIFDRKMSPDDITNDICMVLFSGIKRSG